MTHSIIFDPATGSALCSHCGASPPQNGFPGPCPCCDPHHHIIFNPISGAPICSYCGAIPPANGFTGPCPSNRVSTAQLVAPVPGATVFTHADRRLLQSLANRKRQIHSTTSLADAGAVFRQELQDVGMYETFSAVTGERSVLTKAQVASLAQCHTEREVVAHLFQFLRLMNIPDRARFWLFNSEHYKIIQSLSGNSEYDAKPDGFILHPAMAQHRPPYRGAPDRNGNYGELPSYALVGLMNVILKAKKKCNDDSDFAELCNYLICCTGDYRDETDSPIWMRGILFDKEGFQLVKCYNGKIRYAISCGWTIPGSLKLLSDFIHWRDDPWCIALNHCLQHYGVECIFQDSLALVDTLEGTVSTAVLGSGGYGKVFNVRSTSNNSQYALKIIVHKNDDIDVDGEFQRLMDAANIPTCAQYVVHPVPDSIHTFEFIGRYETELDQYINVPLHAYCYLLSEIGVSINKSKLKKKDLQGMITALTMLHNAGKVHGDARLPNFVNVGGIWKLIDLRPTMTASNNSKTNDFYQFYKSIGFPAITTMHQNAIKGFVEQNSSISVIVDAFWLWYKAI